ncbi:hypothetical protein BGW38_009606 [Lunasporangiospora selenospora]|uniref:Uncharacterized protein n=1 Tax=Lunasporangiospora selenospora TaxID=979761 RepID=A0A9P6K5T4_9FUNG|nr:hypothetical protein BGW38_009606 [Lunasporangiospora selenospora]
MAFGNHHPAGIFTAAGSNRRPQQSQETSEDNLDSVDASKGLTPPAVNQEHGRKNSFDRLASLKLKKDMLLKRSSSLIGSGRNAIANAGLHPPLLSRRMTEDRRMSEDDPLLAGMKMND